MKMRTALAASVMAIAASTATALPAHAETTKNYGGQWNPFPASAPKVCGQSSSIGGVYSQNCIITNAPYFQSMLVVTNMRDYPIDMSQGRSWMVFNGTSVVETVCTGRAMLYPGEQAVCFSPTRKITSGAVYGHGEAYRSTPLPRRDEKVADPVQVLTSATR